MQKTSKSQPTEKFFPPRTVNLTSIAFTKEKQELLDLGTQHSIQQPIEAYWTNLILETEHAIRLPDPKFHRLMATKKLNQIHNASHNSKHHTQEIFTHRRSLKIRYKEHIRYIRYNNPQNQHTHSTSYATSMNTAQ